MEYQFLLKVTGQLIDVKPELEVVKPTAIADPVWVDLGIRVNTGGNVEVKDVGSYFARFNETPNEAPEDLSLRRVMRAAAKFPPIFTGTNTVGRSLAELDELNREFYLRANAMLLDLDDEESVWALFYSVLCGGR